MTARLPTTVRLSLDELARHGGTTGPHEDGWGIAFYDDADALLIRDPERAAGSAWVSFLESHQLSSTVVLAHIRRATRGPKALRNTQPFVRELGGRAHVFSHNGKLDGIDDHLRFQGRRFRPIGDTDSEVAFCALLERIAELESGPGIAPLDRRLETVAAFAAELRSLGPANFLYSDGDVLFAHAHRRTQADGTIRPPGLHLLCRSCARVDGADAPNASGISWSAVEHQDVALVASVPLTTEPWRAMEEGEVAALRAGAVVARRRPTRDGDRPTGRRRAR